MNSSFSVQFEKSIEYSVRRWIELHGNLPVTSFNRKHLAEFSEALKGLPTTKIRQVSNLSIRQAILLAKIENLETMGVKIRKTRIDHIKRIMQYAKNQMGIIITDPFEGFQVNLEKRKFSYINSRRRKSIPPRKILEMIDFCTSNYHPDTIDYWAPILGAYTGARREEIGQLHINDVQERAEYLVLIITDEREGQKVKNFHSLRTLPVPSAVLSFGFREFVERRLASNANMLFTVSHFDNKEKLRNLIEIRQSGRGRYTETYGTRFVREVIGQIGLANQHVSFHSLRHSWTDAARRAGINSEIRRICAGRLDGEDPTEAKYGASLMLAEKLTALDAVAPFLTLSE